MIAVMEGENLIWVHCYARMEISYWNPFVEQIHANKNEKNICVLWGMKEVSQKCMHM
jgi:hypothetical protein